MRKVLALFLAAGVTVSSMLFGALTPAHAETVATPPHSLAAIDSTSNHVSLDQVTGSAQLDLVNSLTKTVTEARMGFSRKDIGSGWASSPIRDVVNAGDFDKKGYDDIIMSDSAGRLWLYPARSATAISPRVQIGTGWRSMRDIVGGADFNGDGNPDLLAVDAGGKLHLYPGNGKGRLLPRRTIGASGWQNVRSISAVSTGYDGKPIITGIMGQNLVQWRSNGKGSITSRVTVGFGGWNTISHVAMTGDATGDGWADLWAVAPDGRLRIYVARNANGTRFTGYDAGTGWSATKYLLPRTDNARAFRAIFPDGKLRQYTASSYKLVTVQRNVLNSTSAASLQVLVNKKNPLKPQNYMPANLVNPANYGVPARGSFRLRKEAATALGQMYKAARKAGVGFTLSSAYRSYATQKSLYAQYTNQYGSAYANRISARAGYSEHQTGLAVDITTQATLTQSFGTTASGKWLAANAYKYGYILRYPKGAESITGFSYEPWHFRYVGTEVSQAMHAKGIATYEQYLKAPNAPSY